MVALGPDLKDPKMRNLFLSGEAILEKEKEAARRIPERQRYYHKQLEKNNDEVIIEDYN